MRKTACPCHDRPCRLVKTEPATGATTEDPPPADHRRHAPCIREADVPESRVELVIESATEQLLEPVEDQFESVQEPFLVANAVLGDVALHFC